MNNNKLDLVSVWAGNWTFCEGTPAEGWQHKRQPGIDFALDACINLDYFCDSEPIPEQSEAVLYASIKREQDTNALLGIGCDNYFEAYCDGKLLKSTYKQGNGQNYIFPENHRIEFFVEKGEHLLAVRVKRGKNSWYFACGYCPPIPAPEPEISAGPWLSNPDIGLMSVSFTCNTELGCAVQYRLKGTEQWKQVWNQRQGQCLRRIYHKIKLESLQPGGLYEYQIVALHPSKYLPQTISSIHSFKAPDDKCANYSFFFTADLQFEAQKQKQILEQMLKAAEAQTCDFFVLGGDVNSAFLPEALIEGPFTQLCEHGAAGKPIIYVRGNHEMRGQYGERFLDYFASNIDTSYDLMRYGDTAFLILDAWEDKSSKTPGHTYCQWNLDELFYEQHISWFKQALRDDKWTSARRRIVLCHGAAYSHSDRYKAITRFLQGMTDPCFAGLKPQHDINMWFAGHVHNYMRSIPGTDKIAAAARPGQPIKDGRNYKYPVLTVAGPGVRAVQASCFRVDADALGFTLRSWDQQGRALEHIRYQNEGGCEEIISLPHYSEPAEEKPPSNA